MKNSGSYIASGETPCVICAYGKTPGIALKKLGKMIDKMIKEDQNTIVLSTNSSYDEYGIFNINATLSTF
jgi:hypothetical protein